MNQSVRATCKKLLERTKNSALRARQLHLARVAEIFRSSACALLLSVDTLAMAPATIHNLEHIVHDLKHSNYFRVWALTFLATFIIFWVGMWLARARSLKTSRDLAHFPVGFGVYVNHVDATSQVYASGFVACY